MQDLSAFKGILPYASELFGIYQPLLGWKSQITARRFDRARMGVHKVIAQTVLNRVNSPLTVQAEGGHELGVGRFVNAQFRIVDLKPVDLEQGLQPVLSPSIDSGVARLLREGVGAAPPRDWNALVNQERMTSMLDRLQRLLTEPGQLAERPDIATYVDTFVAALDGQDRASVLRAFFDKESRIAGYLIFLAQHSPSQLTALFFRSAKADALQMVTFADPLLSFGEDAYKAILSPVGVIHLYREYFFEFDSFLGPPVGHVWLTPGATVELIEVSTRKVFIEHTFEMATETTQRSESEVTSQDDIADAVKEENRNNVKFGFTNTASVTTPVFQDTVVTSLALDNTKSSARESTHKQMRRQSEKLSSEIKRNFKTTFKTSTEVTDTTSKRFVMQNTTQRLVNYELRRKMRKVGVQVQDIGVQMCWHTFVDDPGRELGIAKLVHMGERPELANLVQPDAPPNLTIQEAETTVPIPFAGLDGNTSNDESYTHGIESDWNIANEAMNKGGADKIRPDFGPFNVTFAQPGFTLTDVKLEVVGGFDAIVSRTSLDSVPGSSKGAFNVHIDYVNWNEASGFTVKALLTWSPVAEVDPKVKAAYDAKVAEYTAEKARRYKEAFLAASRERIKVASKVGVRKAEDLREEERTVVYRRLIAQLMSVAPKESKHVISELVRSIFDIDKMLYFVAPEWWVPRLHWSAQHLGEEEKPPAPGPAPRTVGQAAAAFQGSAIRMSSMIRHAAVKEAIEREAAVPPRGTPIPAANIVDWGGAMEYGRDNYYITEESEPAKLGSSLGWLLQLDGDNLRNAVLNAPWVKAVIPIRIGKEREAINWLRQAHVEGNDGLDADYPATPDDPPELHGVTVLGALTVLANKINEFDRRARTSIIGNPADPEDPSNHFAGSMPTEAVFENGFYPLKGGVRFNQEGTDQAIFSQWMEILPTDQVAALEVEYEYDPKTLQAKLKVVQPTAAGGGNGEDDD